MISCVVPENQTWCKTGSHLRTREGICWIFRIISSICRQFCSCCTAVSVFRVNKAKVFTQVARALCICETMPDICRVTRLFKSKWQDLAKPVHVRQEMKISTFERRRLPAFYQVPQPHGSPREPQRSRCH